MGDSTCTDPADRLRLVESLLAAAGDSLSALQRLLAEVTTEVSLLRRSQDPASPEAELRALRREVEQLREGMASRAVIERAKGILMQAHALTEQQAFELLTELSHDRHRKLRDVAGDVVDGSLSPRARSTPPAAPPQQPEGSASRERPHLVREAATPPAAGRGVPRP